MGIAKRFLGNVRVDDLTVEECLNCIEHSIDNKLEPGIVMTINPQRFMFALQDEEYREIINTSRLVTNDGIGISLAAKILGVRLRGRVTGAGLVGRFAEMSANKGYKIFILGASPGIAQKAADKLSEKHPKANFVGTHHGFYKFDSEEEEEILENIKELKPDMILLAFGAPKEEKWLKQHLKKLDIPIGVGVGAGIDFAAGEQIRAPQWIRKLGVEWLFRLLTQPKRLWKRYLIGNFTFLFAIVKFRFSHGRQA